MREQQELEEEYDRFLRVQPPSLSEDERARIRALSRDIPALWHAPGTTAADRKEIIRLLVERVVVQVRNDSEEVEATIQWRGGSTSHHTIVRPVGRYEHLRGYDRLVEHLVRWRGEGYSAGQIAAKLQAAGFRPPRKQGVYTKGQVQQLLRRCGLTHEEPGVGELGLNEWWLPHLAVALDLSATKLAPLGGAAGYARGRHWRSANGSSGPTSPSRSGCAGQGPFEGRDCGPSRRIDHAGGSGMSGDGTGDRNRIVI